METMSVDDKILFRGEVIENPGRIQTGKVGELRKTIKTKIGKDLKELKQKKPVWYKASSPISSL